jgi:hypothetical protein
MGHCPIYKLIQQKKIMSKLTLEQQFKLAILNDQIQNLNLAQSHKYIYDLIQQDMIKNNLFKALMRGDDNNPNLND